MYIYFSMLNEINRLFQPTSGPLFASTLNTFFALKVSYFSVAIFSLWTNNKRLIKSIYSNKSSTITTYGFYPMWRKVQVPICLNLSPDFLRTVRKVWCSNYFTPVPDSLASTPGMIESRNRCLKPTYIKRKRNIDYRIWDIHNQKCMTLYIFLYNILHT